MIKRAVSLVLGLCACLLISNQPAAAQETPEVWYEVAYMSVAPDKAEEYLKLEREVWKPIHQERVKAGVAVGWDLYTVWFPGGTDAPYQYVTVNIYDDLAKVPNGYSEELVKKAHPDVDMAEFGAKTVAARDLARTELWVQRDIAVPDATLEVGNYLSIGYMKVPSGGGGAFLRLESEVFKPVHEARIAGGFIHNFGINQMFLPAGTGQEYNWAVVQVYGDFGKMFKGMNMESFEKAHPGIPPAVFQSADEVRDMVRVDLWELIDQVR